MGPPHSRLLFEKLSYACLVLLSPPSCVTLGIGSNQVTRLSRMILCIQLGISQRRGTRSYNRLSLRRCPRQCTYTFGTISLIRLSLYRSNALHNMGKGTCSTGFT